MWNDTVDYDLTNFKSEVRFKFLHKFWEAILSFDPFNFYLLLDESIDLKGESKQKLTEKLHYNFLLHKFFGDEELVLFFYKEKLNNKSFLDCDFMGGQTGFSTILRFEFKNEKVTAIYFVEEAIGLSVENLIDLYTLKEIEDRVFIRKQK